MKKFLPKAVECLWIVFSSLSSFSNLPFSLLVSTSRFTSFQLFLHPSRPPSDSQSTQKREMVAATRRTLHDLLSPFSTALSLFQIFSWHFPSPFPLQIFSWYFPSSFCLFLKSLRCRELSYRVKFSRQFLIRRQN